MPNIYDFQQITARKMIMIGKGQVTASPDLAILRLGVQTNGENVTVAQNENARISQNIVNFLRQAGITDFKTVQYQIEPMYDYENGERINRGYQVRNILEITISDMSSIGSIIDSAVQYGANIVESVRFDIENQDIYYQKALNLAVNNAIRKAKSITSGLGIITDPIPMLITENMVTPIPYSTTFLAREGSATTPIESGSMQISASVTVEFTF